MEYVEEIGRGTILTTRNFLRKLNYITPTLLIEEAGLIIKSRL